MQQQIIVTVRRVHVLNVRNSVLPGLRALVPQVKKGGWNEKNMENSEAYRPFLSPDRRALRLSAGAGN